jgi:hypothetical protein
MEESREMVNTTDSRDKSREDIKLGSGAFRLITIRIAVQYKINKVRVMHVVRLISSTVDHVCFRPGVLTCKAPEVLQC